MDHFDSRRHKQYKDSFGLGRAIEVGPVRDVRAPGLNYLIDN